MNKLLFYPYYAMFKSKPEFELGITVFTEDAWKLVENNCIFINEIDACFERYIHKDLGVLGEDNGDGYVYEVKDGEEILGMYPTSKGNICICTSYDRKTTLIFLSSER